MEKKATVSIIVPVYNGAATLESCLSAIFQSSFQPIEVIVSDDASTDTSSDIARAFGVNFLESTHDKPCGAASARNRAAREAGGDYLFFTDADVLIKSDTIARIVNLFETEPAIDAVIGSYTCDTPIDNFLSKFKNFLHHYTHQHSAEQAITFWTACGGIRRDVFQKSGGFNENYDAASVEDIAFGYKLTKLGFHIHLLKELQVTHLKRYSLKSLVISDIFFRAVPWTRLMLREKIFRSDLNTSFSSAVGLVCTYLMLPSFLLGLIYPAAFWFFMFFTCIFLGINLQLYRYLYQRVDRMFVMKFVLMSYVYYLYCGLGLIIAIGGYLCGRKY